MDKICIFWEKENVDNVDNFVDKVAKTIDMGSVFPKNRLCTSKYGKHPMGKKR